MLSIIVGVLMATFVLGPSVSAQRPGSQCFTRRGKRGVCEELSVCESHVQMLPPPGYTISRFLSQSVCTYLGQAIYVCCPNPIDGNSNNKNDNSVTINNPLTPSWYGPLLPPICGTTDAKYTRIVDGVPAQLGQWPWIAALGYRGLQGASEKIRWLCGASLISARHVITAAHCIDEHDDLFVVRLGDVDLEDDNDRATPINAFIDKSVIHPQYDRNYHTNDIGILRLQFDIQFTPFIRPLCLPLPNNLVGKNLEGTFPFVAGWGNIRFRGPRSLTLQQIQLPIVSQDVCKKVYMNFREATIDERVICAGFDTGKDACKGDSGGPLMYPIGRSFYAIGIVSYGYECATPGYPGVYTNVSSFTDFIIPLLV